MIGRCAVYENIEPPGGGTIGVLAFDKFPDFPVAAVGVQVLSNGVCFSCYGDGSSGINSGDDSSIAAC